MAGMPAPLLRLCRRALLLTVVAIGWAAPARADLTVFAGLQNQPAIRPATGISLGFGVLAIGWEIEVARVGGRTSDGAPSISMGTGSVYVQNPIPIAGVQFYALAGAGLFRERLDLVDQQTDVHVALGGGAKIELVGPLKLRLDYRFFRFRDAIVATNPQRVYAGLTLAF